MFGVLALDLTVRADSYTTSLQKLWVARGAIAVLCLLCASSVSGRTQTQKVSLDDPQMEGSGVTQTTKMSAKPVAKLNETRHRATGTDEPVVPPTSYVATAYSLRGRTASGRPVARGLIAADPRYLPLGSRVRLEAGTYSGEYLVVDTSKLVRGRRIDIWTPTSREAIRFGKRTVKLTVLSAPDRSPVKVREDLEKEYVEKKISNVEYQKRYADWLTLADQTAKASASYYMARPALYKAATLMPAKFEPIDPNEKTLADTTHERFRLRIDLTRKIISQAEYDEKLAAIVYEEQIIARKGALSASDMVHYYKTADTIQPSIALLENDLAKPEGLSSELIIKLVAILLPSFGLAVSLYIHKKKDSREKEALDLEKRKLELAEVSSREAMEKTRLLLETKQYQIKEMTLRIAQLERELGDPSKKLVIP